MAIIWSLLMMQTICMAYSRDKQGWSSIFHKWRFRVGVVPRNSHFPSCHCHSVSLLNFEPRPNALQDTEALGLEASGFAWSLRSEHWRKKRLEKKHLMMAILRPFMGVITPFISPGGPPCTLPMKATWFSHFPHPKKRRIIDSTTCLKWGGKYFQFPKRCDIRRILFTCRQETGTISGPWVQLFEAECFSSEPTLKCMFFDLQRSKNVLYTATNASSDAFSRRARHWCERIESPTASLQMRFHHGNVHPEKQTEDHRLKKLQSHWLVCKIFLCHAW